MDLEIQLQIKNLADTHGAENLVVILGGADAEASGLACETVTNGDPVGIGPLAGVQLGLLCYHIFEPEIEGLVDPAAYEENVSVMKMVLDADEIVDEVAKYRKKYCKFL